MRADRLLNMMLLLQSHGKMTTRELADKLILGRVTYTDKFLQMAEFIKDEAGQPAQLRLRFDTEEEAVRYVLGYGGRMKVERPAHLIPHIVEEARQVLRLYEEA